MEESTEKVNTGIKYDYKITIEGADMKAEISTTGFTIEDVLLAVDGALHGVGFVYDGSVGIIEEDK